MGTSRRDRVRVRAGGLIRYRRGPRREDIAEDVAEDAEDVVDAHAGEVVHRRAVEAIVPKRS